MRVCYNIHTHRDPAQVDHLVRTITAGAADCVVLISHDSAGDRLDVAALERLGNVAVQPARGGYGDFSHVDRHLDAIRWLRETGTEVDWLVNLTGQCYPLKPISAIERELATAGVDGFLEYFPAFGPDRHWPEHRARSRYLFHHRRLMPLSAAWKRRLRPLQAVNFVQPLVRLHVAYGLTVGWRVRSPFGPELRLHGGSAFMSLSRAVIDYLADFHTRRRDLSAYFRRTLSPVEAYLPTILLNADGFTFANDCKRYFDFRNSQFNHPRILDSSDVDAALASGAHFGRKFDLSRDPEAIARLDAVVRGQPGAGGPAAGNRGPGCARRRS